MIVCVEGGGRLRAVAEEKLAREVQACGLGEGTCGRIAAQHVPCSGTREGARVTMVVRERWLWRAATR